MAGVPLAGRDISALIQIQGNSLSSSNALTSLSSLRSMRAASDSSPLANNSDSGTQESAENSKAVEVANKFEALLIHNMLKGMRKTTMSDDVSNERALYDDMLDQQLADTMIESGGLGIAKQILSHIQRGSENISTASATTTAISTTQDHVRLRELAQGGASESVHSSSSTGLASTDIARLRLASELWGNEEHYERAMTRQNFLQPLQSHANASAQKLGTTPNAVLAVAALETGWGRHMIADESGSSTHNYFGIKATKSSEQYTNNSTTEFLDGKSQKVQARFKAYSSPADSVDDFANFILENPRYSTALKHAANPERFIQELQKAGYATDPKYADKVISILHQIDRHPSPL